MRDGQTNDDEQVKLELLSQWKVEAESRNQGILSKHHADDDAGDELIPPANYPETLKAAYVLNAPKVFQIVFRIVKVAKNIK